MNTKTTRIFFFGVALFLALVGVRSLRADAATPSQFGLSEGDIISAVSSSDPDIYIVNEHGYKRLFLNPAIFNFYGHLGGFSKVKTVTSQTRDAFGTSGLFRNCETNDPRVWAVEVSGEDIGVFHHVDISGSAAASQDPNFFKKIFCINTREESWYPKGSGYSSLSQVPPYTRTPGATPTPTPISGGGGGGGGGGSGSGSTPTPTPGLTPTPTPSPTTTPTPTPSPTSTPTPTPTPSPTSTPQPTPTPTPAQGAWVAPIGIPAPSFGIQEVAGAATHYVDNTHAASTDTNNPNGTTAVPRKTIPTSLAAGSVVEVRGGPYTGSGTLTITSSGTASAPVFVRGPSTTQKTKILNRAMSITGTYIIVENLDFENSRLDIAAGARFVGVRNNENHHKPATGAVINISGSETAKSEYVVVYRNYLHDNTDLVSTGEVDNHAVKPGRNSANVWVLENNISGSGGDSVQVGGANYSEAERPKNVYIGKNIMHEDRENAVDIKAANDVVVSQNVMYGYTATGSSAGEAVVVHDNPNRVWIINNTIYNAAIGVISTGSNGFYVLNNVIYDSGIAVRTRGTPVAYIIGNTIYRAGTGVNPQSGTGAAHIINNIISDITGTYHVEFGNTSVAGASEMHHNVFYEPGGTVSVLSKPTTGNTIADPLFVNAGASNFTVQSGSPAVNAGTNSGLVQTVLNAYTYGPSIARDREGVNRPQGSAWDIGAYER